MKDIKISFHASIKEEDIESFKKFLFNHATETISPEFEELKDIWGWEIEELDKKG